MDTAIRIFFNTGNELERLKRKAANVRVANVEDFVDEFRQILTNRAVAAEALDVYNQAEVRAAIAELRQLGGDRQHHQEA